MEFVIAVADAVREKPVQDAKHPLAVGMAAMLFAHLDCHAREAQLFDLPSWAAELDTAQWRTHRFSSHELDRSGLPDAMRVLHEIVTVSSCTNTDLVVQILALQLLERLLHGDPESGLHVSPGMRIHGHNWGMMWLLCVSLAAKLHYDVRPTATPHAPLPHAVR